jgi:hypothetical protein
MIHVRATALASQVRRDRPHAMPGARIEDRLDATVAPAPAGADGGHPRARAAR